MCRITTVSAVANSTRTAIRSRLRTGALKPCAARTGSLSDIKPDRPGPPRGAPHFPSLLVETVYSLCGEGVNGPRKGAGRRGGQANRRLIDYDPDRGQREEESFWYNCEDRKWA